MLEVSRRAALGLGFTAIAAPLLPANVGGVAKSDSFHFDHVLGTSLDGELHGTADSLERTELAILEEVERLRMVFSLHDANSELSKVNRATGPVEVSPDLLAVLKLIEHWRIKSGGALNAQIGSLTRAWREAAQFNREPDTSALESTVRRIASPGWAIDGNRVERRTDQPFDLNSVAKGYILQKAGEMARAIPGIESGFLDLGGDLFTWGECDWTLGVQDPFAPAENAPLSTSVNIRNASIATSGNYQRHYAVHGIRHSHILDPRSGRPADAIASATVIAPDSTTANALATILCVLTPVEGLKLLAEVAGTAGLIVTAKGEECRTPNFIRFEDPKPAVKKEEKKDEKIVAWPDDYEVKINLELPTPTGTRPRRPYVAIWIEDGDGKAIRTVAVWGNSPKWINTMSGWWKIGKDDKDLVKAVSRATRAPGKYEVVWDGKNDAGKAVGQGTYTVKVEVHREHGKDVTQTGKIECLKESAKLTLEKNAETEETTVAFAKKEKKDKK